MKIIDTLQNSDEWLAMRKNKIGASDANVIMGVSEYTTRRELHFLKKGLEPKPKSENVSNYIQDKGHRIEPKIRSILEIETGIDFPAVTAVSDIPDLEFLMASLDGCGTDPEDGQLVLAECKYVGQENFELVKSGQWLPHYYPQIQQQLMLTGAKFCWLAVATDDKDNEKGDLKYEKLKVFPDHEYMKTKLIPELVKFWHEVQNNIDPGYGPDDVMNEDSNEYLVDALTRLKLMEEELKEQEERVAKTKKEVFKLARHTRVECMGHKLLVYKQGGGIKTSIDYEKFIQDQKITVPPEYISTKESKPATVQKITWAKEEKLPTASEIETKAEAAIVPGAEISGQKKTKPKKEKKDAAAKDEKAS